MEFAVACFQCANPLENWDAAADFQLVHTYTDGSSKKGSSYAACKMSPSHGRSNKIRSFFHMPLIQIPRKQVSTSIPHHSADVARLSLQISCVRIRSGLSLPEFRSPVYGTFGELMIPNPSSIRIFVSSNTLCRCSLDIRLIFQTRKHNPPQYLN